MRLPFFNTFLLFLLIFWSCKKESGLDIGSNCLKQHLVPSFPTEDTTYNCCNCVFDWEEVYSATIPYDYFYPCLNPTNNDQMAYYRHDNTQALFTGHEIWVADFCKNEKRSIVKDALYGINWSKNDWIFYTAVDQNIYKLKSNGDSLIQVTFTTNGYNRYPKISPSGNKFMYQSDVGGITNLWIQDLLSGKVDTIKTTPAISAWSWIDDERIFYTELGSGNTQYLVVFNIYTRQEKKLQQISIQGSLDSLIISAIPLLKENTVLWCANKVIGKTNLSSGETSILLKAFKQEWFLEIAVPVDESAFILSKRTMHQIDDCHIDSNFDFYVIDKNPTKEQRIAL